MDKATKELLKLVGIPQSIRGHAYIGQAVEMVHKDPCLIHDVINKVYTPVAARFDVSWKRVERAIRTAKESCFDNLSEDLVREIFGNTINPNNGIPTNAHFIAALADLLEATHEQAD